MAVLDITEFSQTGSDSFGFPLPVGFRKVLNQQVAVSATPAPSAAVSGITKLVRLHTDVTIRVEIGGAAPVAGATSFRMYANTTEYVGVDPGAVISAVTSA